VGEKQLTFVAKYGSNSLRMNSMKLKPLLLNKLFKTFALDWLSLKRVFRTICC